MLLTEESLPGERTAGEKVRFDMDTKLIKTMVTPTLNSMRIWLRPSSHSKLTFNFAIQTAVVLSLCLAPFLSGNVSLAATPAGPPTQSDTLPAGQPFTAAQLETLVPATVYFRGKVAPVQLRNAGGVRFADDGIFFAVMVDTAGYSSSVQETYQFYLVTEKPVRFGGQLLSPGAYGAGFVNGRFIVMDIGGKTLLQGNTSEDKELKRPRPLQVLQATAKSIRLYLGRQYVLVEAAV